MSFSKSFVCLVTMLALSVSVLAQTQLVKDESRSQIRIVKRTYDDISEKNQWEIKVSYPDVTLTSGRSVTVFNDAAKNFVMKEVARFKKDMPGSQEENLRPPKGVSYFQTIGYTVEHLDARIVSVRFIQSEYTGGAHPNSWSKTLNFDVKKDREVELKDLFSPGSNYLKLISDASIELLMEQMRVNGNPDSEWVRTGAGPDTKNYSRWNITKKGFLVTFDPYQVGPYVYGSFEVVVPYDQFPQRVRGETFFIAESASYIDGSPPSFCRGGRWTMLDSEYKLASVIGVKNARAYFYGDDNDCPDGKNCRRKAYLISGDEVVVQRVFGDFSCVWYQPKKGSETVGWVRNEQLKSKTDNYELPRKWSGEWTYADNTINIKKSPGEKLHVYGTAFWKGLGDNVHIGEIDFLEYPNLDLLEIGDGLSKYDCRVRLRRLGKYLLVNDNLQCGGANVSFNGVYVKK